MLPWRALRLAGLSLCLAAPAAAQALRSVAPARLPAPAASLVLQANEAAAWRGSLGDSASLSGPGFKLSLRGAYLRETFVRVAVRSGLPAAQFQAAAGPEARAALVTEAVGAYTRGLLSQAQGVETQREAGSLYQELDDLRRVLPLVADSDRAAVRKLHAVLRSYLEEESARRVRLRVREALADWQGRSPEEGSAVADSGQRRPAGLLARTRGTLAGLFSGERIRRVFNGDAGTGSWQKDIQGQPWLDKDAQVTGFELAAPKNYAEYDRDSASRPDPRSNWRDVAVLTSPEDPRYPRAGSVDLAHVAFLDMSGDWRKRLQGYMSLVREGGFFLIAHNHQYDETAFAQYNYREKVRDQVSIEFVSSGEWELIAAFNEKTVPSDYPVTEWWRIFQHRARDRGDEIRRQGYQTNNFLLVFRKKLN
ncbi:MAG: hypothetical protein NTY77_00185 [Elusimicrobia bacterium]|nr:hypothetical protein [Elusimicrobiota bacterium]